MTDPAGTLRAAAERLRTLAEAATPGPWWWAGGDEYGPGELNAGERRKWHPDGRGGGWYGPECWVLAAIGYDDSGAICGNPDDAAYIAAMSPPVALAVADLLEQIAHWIRSTPNSEIAAGSPDARAALAVARLVLGEAS